ncbi:MAG: hypothetical protein M1457_09375 [bacterium]|nr:hypothetical protein [bacterium]
MRGTLLEAQSSHGTHPWGRAPLHRHESVARPLLGLLVVWFTMFTVFMAHHMSDYDIELAHESAKSPAPDNVFLYPLKLYSRGTSPRQGLLNIAQNVGLQVDPINLDKLGDEPRTLDYRDVPRE